MISAQLRKSFFYLFPKEAASYRRALCPHFFSAVAASDNQPAKRKPRNSESVLVFFRESGFSDAQLEKVLKKKPRLRSANVEKSIKPKISVFKEFGFSYSQIAKIISAEPSILDTSAGGRLFPSLSLLQNLLGCCISEVVTLRRPGLRYLTSDMSKTLYPNIEFLKSRGLSMQRIICLLRIAPGSLSMKPEILRKHVEKLEVFGFDSSSKMYNALWVSSCMNDRIWELKFQTFRNLGFVDSEIMEIFRKAPQVFATSPEKIERVVQVVLSTKRYTVKSMVSNPQILWSSIEKRIKPRLQVLEILEKSKLIKKWPALPVLRFTDQRFHEKFVAPYPTVFTGSTESQKDPCWI